MPGTGEQRTGASKSLGGKTRPPSQPVKDLVLPEAVEPAHGASMFGELKYGPGFEHFKK